MMGRERKQPKLQVRITTKNDGYFETDFTHAALYNAGANKYMVETMSNLVKEREAGIRDESWVVVDVFFNFTQAVEYVGKNR